MAIQPLTFPTAQPYSAVSFAPLNNLANQAWQTQQKQSLAKLGSALAPDTTPADAQPAQSSYASAIAANESGGKYDALGPVTKGGDRAYGKYQIMGANIPAWTQQTFGKSMTPDQFLANPAAQDAVFNKIFGGYVDKYGPTGAAKAWFAGEGGMNNPNAKDDLGTTVDAYAKRFNQNYYGGDDGS